MFIKQIAAIWWMESPSDGRTIISVCHSNVCSNQTVIRRFRFETRHLRLFTQKIATNETSIIVRHHPRTNPNATRWKNAKTEMAGSQSIRMSIARASYTAVPKSRNSNARCYHSLNDPTARQLNVLVSTRTTTSSHRIVTRSSYNKSIKWFFLRCFFWNLILFCFLLLCWFFLIK